MVHVRRTVLGKVAAVAVAVLSVCLPARAQFGMGGMEFTDFLSPISKKSVETYAQLVGMDADQKSTALALQDGYRASFKQFQEDVKKQTKEMMEKVQDSGDWSSYGKDAAKMGQQLTERMEKLEKEFFENVKATLNPAQLEKWPRVERMRRRDNTMRMSFVSGQNVDLFKMLSNVGVKFDATPELSQEMERYEMELEKQLKAFETWGKEQQEKNVKMMEGGMQNFDMTKIQDMMKEMTTMAKAIRDTNRQFARTVEPLLPADKQAKFDMEIKRRSFPKVYKEGYPAKAIAEAMKFNDLDASQKETIALLKEGYERDVETANKAWAAAIEEREEKNGGTMGAMMAMYTGGGDGKDAVGDARKARRELDGRVKDKLMTLLNEEQKKRLPEDKPDPKDNRMGMDFFNVDPPEQDD